MLCIRSSSDSRNAHDGAQGEQHKEAVPHGESCAVRAAADAGEDAMRRNKNERRMQNVSVCYPCLAARVTRRSWGWWWWWCKYGAAVSGKVLLSSVRSANTAGVVGLSAKTRAGALAAHLPVTSVCAQIDCKLHACACPRQSRQQRSTRLPVHDTCQHGSRRL
jgi:hypothetical protein